jgi:hypothetical protein
MDNIAVNSSIKSLEILKKLSPALNTISAVIDLAVAVKGIIPSAKVDKFYQSKEIIKVVPPGEWKHAITVSDWDPYDRFSIDVIPLLAKDIKQSESIKLENVNFSIDRNNSKASTGFQINMETAGGGNEKNLLWPILTAYKHRIEALNMATAHTIFSLGGYSLSIHSKT